jgi:Uma2 family endonuclease
VSFIRSELLKELMGHAAITIPPTFCIEIVSAPAGLKKDLEKMKNDWMAAGTELGMVIDPFSKKYYIFEQGKEGFEQWTFDQNFGHELLPDLNIDLEKLWKEATENEG